MIDERLCNFCEKEFFKDELLLAENNMYHLDICANCLKELANEQNWTVEKLIDKIS